MSRPTLSTALFAFLWLCAFNSVQAQLEEYRDGRKDATRVIQEMVNSGRGEIMLPPGRFLLSESLQVDLEKTGYCALRGSTATTLVMAGRGPAVLFRGSHFKSADPKGFSSTTWEKERMPQVLDLAIEGKHAEADGIAAVGTMQLTISRVHLRKLRNGIHLKENNRNVLVESCHIYENSGVGIFYDDVNLHQSNITGCHISYCDRGGIVSRGGNVRNLHITGCDLESNMSAEQDPTANVFIDCRGSQYGTAEVAITGCTIQHNDRGPKSANVRIIGSSEPSGGQEKVHEGHVTITGNIFSDVQTNVWLDACRGVTLTGNTFWMGFEHNLLVENSSHIIVGPNNFDRNPRYAYGHSESSKNQLVFRNTRDSTLTGLHIALVKDSVAGISMYDCDRIHVSGLTVLDCELGIYLEKVSRSRFSDCLISNDQSQLPTKKIVQKSCTSNYIDADLLAED